MSVPFWGDGAKRLEVSSPRLRGEVGAKRRVRGALRGHNHHRIRGSSPSPHPLPIRTGRGRRESPPNFAQLSHFATLFPLVLSFGTTLERIAAESLTPPGVPFRSRNMSRDSSWLRTRWSLARPYKRRFEDEFLKAGDGRESNQNRGGVKWIHGWPAHHNKSAKTTPCTVGKLLK